MQKAHAHLSALSFSDNPSLSIAYEIALVFFSLFEFPLGACQKTWYGPHLYFTSRSVGVHTAVSGKSVSWVINKTNRNTSRDIMNIHITFVSSYNITTHLFLRLYRIIQFIFYYRLEWKEYRPDPSLGFVRKDQRTFPINIGIFSIPRRFIHFGVYIFFLTN